MTIRRLNYTRRVRVSRKHVHIAIVRDDQTRFKAQVDLSAYELPADARVFLEAYRQTTWRRFEMGTVGTVTSIESQPLDEFESAAGVRFRLRVVEKPTQSDRPARVLASCDGLRPQDSGDPERAESLLPVVAGEFSDRPWKLELEDGEPVLRISRTLAPDSSALVQTRAFRTLVLPEVLRQIFEGFVTRNAPVEIDDDDPHQAAWLRFAREHLGVPLPREGDDPRDWVDEAVRSWCDRCGVGDEFSGWWSEGASR